MGSLFSDLINAAERQQQQQPQRSSAEGKNINYWLEGLKSTLELPLVQLASMKDGKLDDTAINQLYEITCKIEKRLTRFNQKMYQHIFKQPPTPDPGAIDALKRENTDLKNKMKSHEKDGASRMLNEQIQSLEEHIMCIQGLLFGSIRGRNEEQNPNAERQYIFRHKKEAMDQQIMKIKQLLEDVEKSKEDRLISKTVEDSFKTREKTLNSKIEEKTKENKALSEANETLKLRLSKLAGEKLTENNPAIADLSDPNRPTKLAEVYSEIYDNEWSDAFEALEAAGWSDREGIETLRLTLETVVEFCQRKSETLLEETEKAVNCLFEEFQEMNKASTPFGGRLALKASMVDGQELDLLRHKFEQDMPYLTLLPRWQPKVNKVKQEALQTVLGGPKPGAVTNHVKNFRKEMAMLMAPLVQKAFMSAWWTDECLPQLKPFIKKCLFLGWMMMVQSPPLFLSGCKNGDKFDTVVYKSYTRSGSKVQFIVWPAILLHQNGPVIGKGVAQGQD